MTLDRRPISASFAASALLLLVHCGGATAEQPSGGADGGTEAASGGSDDGGGGGETGACPQLTAVQKGTSCAYDGLTCPAPSVFCEAGGPGRLECEHGVWVEPLGCWEGGVESGGHVVDAGPFACGNTTCAAGQYCTDHPPGIAPADGGTFPDAYMCEPIPASCASSPTCGCIESTIPKGDPCSTSNAPGVTCTDDSAGHVTIHCLGV
jgi:hypothetical protein